MAAVLDDAAQCPSGGSSEVQAWIREADANGDVHILTGCYEIRDILGVAEGSHVIGAGMDKTIFYRDPATFRSRDDAMIWIFGQGENAAQISGIAFVGARDSGR